MSERDTEIWSETDGERQERIERHSRLLGLNRQLSEVDGQSLDSQLGRGTIDAKYGPFTSLLVYCSGAVPAVLKRSRTEESAFMSLGAAVLAVGLLTAISATMALSVNFAVRWFAVLPFGILVGLINLNLERWFVASLRRSRARLGPIFYSLLPRLIIASLLGFLIGEPLIQEMLRAEIDAELQEQQISIREEQLFALQTGAAAEELAALELELDGYTSAEETGDPAVDFLSSELVRLGNKRSDLLDERSALQNEIQALQDQFFQEIASGQNGRPAGQGPVAASLSEQISRQEDRLSIVLQDIGAVEAEIDSVRQEASAIRLAAISNLERDAAALDAELESQRQEILSAETASGLIASTEALRRLREKSPEIQRIYWLLSSLFIILFLVPTLGRFMYSLDRSRPYDFMLNAIEEDLVQAFRIERELDSSITRLRARALVEHQRSVADSAMLVRDEVAKLTETPNPADQKTEQIDLSE